MTPSLNSDYVRNNMIYIISLKTENSKKTIYESLNHTRNMKAV